MTFRLGLYIIKWFELESTSCQIVDKSSDRKFEGLLLILGMKLLTGLVKSALLLTTVTSNSNSCRLCHRLTAAQCASQPLTKCSEKHSLTEDDRVCMITYEQRMTRNGPTILYSSRCVSKNVCESAIRLGFLLIKFWFSETLEKTIKDKTLRRTFNGSIFVDPLDWSVDALPDRDAHFVKRCH